MRLRKLTIANIGPYAGLAELDATALGDVFLICGKTGSGKSTIFEAVSYALYGQAAVRRELVSHYAEPEDEAFVELEFSVGPERWRVRRKPARTVPKKRGSGLTDRPAEAVLWRRGLSGWEPRSDRIDDIDATLARVIGLSSKEFTKIVLLPQGEFQRFLEMRTGERTEILEKLFPVDLHDAVSELAKLKAKDAEAKARVLDDRAATMEAALGDDPGASLAEARSALAEARVADGAALAARDAANAASQLAAVAARAWDEYDAALAERAALEATEAEAASLMARLSRAEAGLGAEAAVKAAGRARAEKAAAESSLAGAEATLAEADAETEGAEKAGLLVAELAEALEAMDREAGLLSARAAAWQRLSAARERLESATAALGAAMAAKSTAETAAAAASATLAAIESGAADAEALVAERSAAAIALESAREAERLAAEAAGFEAETRALEARTRAAAERSASAETVLASAVDTLAEAEAAVEALRDAQAAFRLASRLGPGSPCPVCGSVEHPAPARPGTMAGGGRGGSSTDDGSGEANALRLEAARAALEAARAEAADAKAALSTLNEAIVARAEGAARYAGALGPEAAEEGLRAARARLVAADRAQAAEAARGRAASAARVEYERLRKILDVAAASVSAAESERSAAAAAAAEASSGSGGDDPGPLLSSLRLRREAAASERAKLESDIELWRRRRGEAVARASEAAARLERAVEALADTEAAVAIALAEAGFETEEAWAAACLPPPELADARERVRARAAAASSSEARFKAAERSVSGACRPDLAAAEAGRSAADEAYAAARARLDAAAAAERELAAGLDALSAVRAERQALRERGDRLVALSALLNGNAVGRHVSFKIFTLASYFALVVERASARLREMSDGRYDMRVDDDRSAGRGFVGLDLSVLDSFTGVARPASSLSGGEKFLASISLALGLSDVIVERAGGVALDSIFIDEGFGSLDDETLDRAMEALDRVRGERVIGIVSHVAELRSRVPARVEVIKTNAGSSLRVVS